LREVDIINATGHTIERIDATLPLDKFNERIDIIVNKIVEKLNIKRNLKEFEPWNPQKEYDSATHIERGYIDADEDVAFYRQVDACNCLGHSYKGLQRALVRHPIETDLVIWFPKLYENDKWNNILSGDEETIHESNKVDNAAFLKRWLNKPETFKRLVFARVHSPLGDVMYRFKGLYEIDVETSRKESAVTHRRTSKRAKTYSPKS
ncbi:MAG: hypothetical protein H7Z37_11830, partial [Pyrinomonadaceae bacterium]|nr:hypothetical protein [Pyrinomonadaceae bacterium]